ncbi:MAG: protein translocase subunit SecD [Actinomycetota bacterium]|nr:protein translocase subunit SecD [Actinomycetota bacterium]
MARPNRAARPGRALLALFALLVVLYGVVGGAHVWGEGQLTPKLGLDLEGGDEIVLEPVASGGKITKGTIDEAINIIRARVDGSGVSEAQVSSQGANNIVVALPGKPSEATKNLVKKAAQLRFRAVIEAATVGAAAAPTATGTPTGTPSTGATGTATGTGTAKASTSAATSTAGRAIPPALAAAATPTPTTTPAAATPSPATTPTAKPTDASDPNWVTPAIQAKYDAETCQNLNALQGNTDDPTKPYVTCSDDGTEKYILGPVEVSGTDIKGAQAQLATNSQGVQTSEWEVQLSFTGGGTSKFGKVTERLVSLTGNRNRFAIEVDGVVISAPTTQSAIEGGIASITGNFTANSARELANQLKYGALPLSFKTLTENSISPTLGKEQLQKSLLAGLIGLLLVVLYAFFQYRLLGLVTVASLTIAAAFTYGMVVYLGWAQGFRLTLAGVTGLIVSIGITADSFIVFFERVRDEVRDGRTLRSAVETGWNRARRTILAADSVSFLAAVVLFLLAAGSVQGFAYTLGLTTLIDVLVVFLFTHPMLGLLARTKFFGEGHAWSGLDPERLGVSARKRRPGSPPVPAVAVAGPASPAVAARRGDTIAARRAAARKAADQGEDA